MKAFGIFCVATAILNFVGLVVAVASSEDEAIGRFVSGVLMFGVLGAFFINRANKKKQSEERRQEWEKGESKNENTEG